MQQLSQTSVLDKQPRGSSPPALSAVARARWDAAVAQELEAPGVMSLVPVIVQGRVLDFVCVAATPRAAALAGSLSSDVVGLEINEITGSWRRALVLVRGYRQAFLDGVETTFLTEERPECCASRVLHHVIPNPTGLTVMLTCPRRGEPAFALREVRREAECLGF